MRMKCSPFFNVHEYPGNTMAADKISPTKAIDTFLSFIQVTIEQIWYHLEVYPHESFSEYMFYQLQVYSSRHPAVIGYTDELMSNLRKMANEGILLKLYIEVYEADSKKYSVGFSFRNSLLFEQLKNDTQFLEYGESQFSFDSFLLINNLKSFLFSVIQELNLIEKQPLKEAGNFKILVSTTDDVEMSKDDKWILERTYDEDNRENSLAFKDVKIKSFKEVKLRYLNIEGYIAGY